MADLSKIKIPNGTEYNLKDAQARADIESLNGSLEEEGFTQSAKIALISCLSNVCWMDANGQSYISDLKSELGLKPISITATYTQMHMVTARTPLESLKTDLIVTGVYTGNVSLRLSSDEYTLSGTLSVGTSSVTVTAGTATATFTVTVVERDDTNLLYRWDFSDSFTDKKSSVVATTNKATLNNGLKLTNPNTYVEFPGVYAKNRTYEYDVTSIGKAIKFNGRLFMVNDNSNTGNGGAGYILTGTSKGGDLFYIGGWESQVIVSKDIDPDGSYYNGSTVSFYVDNDGYVSVYKDGSLLGTSLAVIQKNAGVNIYIGCDNGEYLYPATFAEFRVYSGLHT